MRSIKLGSLFDGSGGFPLAGVMNGMEPVWASEIEPYPIRVTKLRFPQMKHLGDVTKIDGGAIEPVDVITFGSPCQDLSVAGKQKGIHDGERSSLFFEAVRIIKEMRNHDELDGRTGVDIRPRFAVWENVPGAFSSNGGADFQAVLEALCNVRGGANVHVPLPQKGKWLHAGCVVGDGFSVAWRLYDAQYWGVPQRRKRIYLIADFGSERAGEILFERESLRGDPAQGGEARQGAPADAEGSAGGSGGVGCLNPWDSESKRVFDVNGVMHTLYSHENSGGHLNGVCYPAAFMGGQGAKARSIAYCDDGSTPTLKSSPSGGNTVPDVVYSIEGNTVDRDSHKNGKGFCEDVSPTLNTQDKHAVTYAIEGNGQRESHQGDGYSETDKMYTLNTIERHAVCYDARGNGDGKTSPTLTGDHQNRVTDYTAICVGNGQMNQTDLGDKSGALNCMHDQQIVITPEIKPDGMMFVMQRKYIVRRLTPLECCRLQGFPDDWEDGAEGSDSARYKMWGNGIALPCAADVLGRIAKLLKIGAEGDV